MEMFSKIGFKAALCRFFIGDICLGVGLASADVPVAATAVIIVGVNLVSSSAVFL